MMIPMLSQLIRLGLSEKEAKVYLAALELGSQTAQVIARKASVNRATTYVILQSLIKKGLASMFSTGGKTYFAAAAPEHLDHLLRKQEEDIFERRRDLEKMIPELRALHQRAPGKPLVRFFDGEEGVRMLLSDLWRRLKAPALVKAFLAVDSAGAEWSRLLEPPEGVRVEILYTHRDGPQPGLSNVRGTVQSWFVSDREYLFAASVLVIPDLGTVAIIGREPDQSGVSLENPELVKTLTSVFDVLRAALLSRR